MGKQPSQWDAILHILNTLCMHANNFNNVDIFHHLQPCLSINMHGHLR